MPKYNNYGGGMGRGGGGSGRRSREDTRGGRGRHQGHWSSRDPSPNQRRSDQLGPSDHHSPQNTSFSRDRPVMPVQHQQQPESFAINGNGLAQADGFPNHCEILTVGEPNDAYVTIVENLVKAIGLRVDVMIPKPNVKLADFIENLATKGTIFAVVIKPENVPHQSVSVHVLRGQSKEHRNLSLVASCSLIRNEYLEAKKTEMGVVPENIKNILRYTLEDSRFLTDQEYGVAIAFMQERRKRQASFENLTPHGHNDQAYYSPEKLQERILSLLGGIQEPPSSRSRPTDKNSRYSSGFGRT